MQQQHTMHQSVIQDSSNATQNSIHTRIGLCKIKFANFCYENCSSTAIYFHVKSKKKPDYFIFIHNQ